MSKYIGLGGNSSSEKKYEELEQVASLIEPLIRDDSAKHSEFVNKFVDYRNHDKLQEMFFLFIEEWKVMYNTRAGPEQKANLESYFGCLIYLFTETENAQKFDAAVRKLITVLTSDEGTVPPLQLKMLMNTYNSIPITSVTGNLSHMVFAATLKFSQKKGLFAEMIPYLDHVESWVDDWDVPNAKVPLFHDIAMNLVDLVDKVTREKRETEELAFAWLKKYAETEEAVNPQSVNAIQVLAAKALALPSVYEVEEILNFKAVKAVRAADKKTAEILELLDVFVTGTISDLDQFMTAKKAIIQDLGIDNSVLYLKLRGLTLCSLCEEALLNGKQEIPLAEISKKLALGSGDFDNTLEDIIMSAAHYGVLNARIDEMNQILVVQSALKRKFGMDEWKTLQSNLSKWIKKIDELEKLAGGKSLTQAAGA